MREEAQALLDVVMAMVNTYMRDEPERMERPGMVRLLDRACDLEAALALPISSDPSTPHDEFMDFLRTGGKADCPTCERYAAFYKRGLNSSMARGLAVFSRHFKVGEWVDVPEWKAGVGLWQSNDAAQLRHWGLLEPQASEARRSNMAEDSPDHGSVGVWRITPKGYAFVQGNVEVPRFALLYNQQCLGLTGEMIRISDVKGFKYEDLPIGPDHPVE